MKNKRKIFSLRISPFFCPKLRENKKKVFCQILSVFVLKLSAQVTKGGAMPQFYMLFYANYTILATQREGAMAPWPPLNTPLSVSFVYFNQLAVCTLVRWYNGRSEFLFSNKLKVPSNVNDYTYSVNRPLIKH